MDRLAHFLGQTWVMDRKSTKSTLTPDFFKKFNPDIQMTGYTLGGKITWKTPVEGVIIDGVQCAVGFNRFARGRTVRSDYQLDEWLENTVWSIKLAEGYARKGWWPMNETACGNFGGCPYIGVCSKGNPKLRQTWLEADMVRRLWDPLAVRGDI
jgi:hypothetical protein